MAATRTPTLEEEIEALREYALGELRFLRRDLAHVESETADLRADVDSYKYGEATPYIDPHEIRQELLRLVDYVMLRTFPTHTNNQDLMHLFQQGLKYPA